MTEQPPIDRAAAAEVDQQRVLDFLDGSSFGAAKGGKRIDTHASMVFLGGDRALKIKRAVRLPFLDYSTLEKRKRTEHDRFREERGDEKRAACRDANRSQHSERDPPRCLHPLAAGPREDNR